METLKRFKSMLKKYDANLSEDGIDALIKERMNRPVISERGKQRNHPAGD